MQPVEDPKPAFRLEMRGISKAFPGVQALDKVSLQVRPAEVHALVGENGAGKSTLIKILSGAYPRDSGQILIEDHEVEIASPSQALALGIVTIYQESNLSPELNVAENIYMGRLPRAGFFVRWDQLQRQTDELLKQLNLPFGAHTLVKDLSAAQRQMVEIAKALSMSARIIVLDEPTAALTEREVEVLFDVMRRLRDRGVSIIFITHRLAEVFAIADRVTVLRDGRWISCDPIDALPGEETLVARMVGRQIDHIFAKEQTQVGEVALVVRHLSGQGFRDVSFEVRSGEIVGMFGLVGSGRTNVVRALFGAEPATEGAIELGGQLFKPRQPTDSIQLGIALVPEDRKGQGLVLPLSVRSNIALPNLKELARLSFVRTSLERRLAEEFRQTIDIRTPSVETPVQSLSGGNQQKVVISKWLARNPQVLILDEPTRGIDVGGKAEVHRLISSLAAQGAAILMVSSELPEILGMSDRVLVMHGGRLVANIPRQQATEEYVMSFAAGGEMVPENALQQA